MWIATGRPDYRKSPQSADNVLMPERFLYSTLNFTIMSTIALLAATSLICADFGAIRLLSGSVRGGSVLVGCAAASAFAVMLLIRNRNDLADR